MIIKVRDSDNNITIPFPNGMVFNNITAAIISMQKELPITRKQMICLFRELRRARRALGDLPLVEVKSSDGDTVIIRL